jgi:hypothetical protein
MLELLLFRPGYRGPVLELYVEDEDDPYPPLSFICWRARLLAWCRPTTQPTPAPIQPWCPAKWPAVPPTIAPLRHPAAFAGLATNATDTSVIAAAAIITVFNGASFASRLRRA